MATDPVLLVVDGVVATVTLNRPEVLNAIDRDLAESLARTLMGVGADDSVRAVILTGAGKGFCGGGDLKSIAAGDDSPRVTLRRGVAVFHTSAIELRLMPKPVIAAINGVAAGGGLSLALGCDLRLMAESATLKVAYPSAGLSIDGGGSFALPRIVGLARALELVFKDPVLSSADALEDGLVHEVVPAERVMARAVELARDLASRSAPALAAAKKLLYRSSERALESQLEEERVLIGACAETPEAFEAIAAFREKRKPRFYP
jgi:2-(1,2-epoxy-1,2-dihydrophenyl)acetyl-CoA isomerase